MFTIDLALYNDFKFSKEDGMESTYKSGEGGYGQEFSDDDSCSSSKEEEHRKALEVDDN